MSPSPRGERTEDAGFTVNYVLHGAPRPFGLRCSLSARETELLRPWASISDLKTDGHPVSSENAAEQDL